MKQPRWIKEQLNRWKEIQMVRKVDKVLKDSKNFTLKGTL